MSSNQCWSAVELEVLLRCHYSGEPSNGLPFATSYNDARQMWLRHHCVEVCESDINKPNARYLTTERGRKLVQMLCSPPLPISSWRDPRESKS